MLQQELDNRLSNAEPLVKINDTSYAAGDTRNKITAPKRARKNKAPHLRLAAKSPPSGLNVPCKFAVGKALEIERALSAAKDPGKSIWLEDYCRWRRETWKEGCPVSDEVFYYGHLCGFRG